jgi:hypothetical protein
MKQLVKFIVSRGVGNAIDRPLVPGLFHDECSQYAKHEENTHDPECFREAEP